MQEILSAHSLSYAQSIRVALELEGIEVILLNENALGYMNLAGAIRVAVVNDADEERAREIVRSLEPAPAAKRSVTRAWKWERRGLRLMGFALLVVFATSAIESGLEGSWLLTFLYVVTATSGAIGFSFFVAGLFFMEEKAARPAQDEVGVNEDTPPTG